MIEVMFLSAADQGYARAQAILGDMYFEGHGVDQNYAEAMRWYRKAADQGEAKAQFNLGVMYENGQGVDQDNAEAMRCVVPQGRRPSKGMLKHRFPCVCFKRLWLKKTHVDLLLELSIL